ncbi:MAG: regulatory iron-sulfur-containing complex subunit RicT [Patescibacteria group bacterium]
MVRLKIFPWMETIAPSPDFDLQIGDKVLVNTEIGPEIGTVTGFLTEDGHECLTERKIIHPASAEDLKKGEELAARKGEAEEYCRKMIKKYVLPMKLIDAHFSFDGGRLTFAFVSDGRVDFRELVKDLTRHFKKSIRLQQIGMRDEARREGGFGACGRELCCTKFMNQLGNVTTELARDQQIAHRGSERLSGACGRLVCCLSFEEPMYKELMKNLPPLESEVKTKKGKGKVIAWNVMKQSYRVRLENGTEVEIHLDKNIKE